MRTFPHQSQHLAKLSSYRLGYPASVSPLFFFDPEPRSHQTAGKTSISVALEHLFHFGHTQSDDVKGKRPASNFIKNVKNLLGEDDVDVVIADKCVQCPRCTHESDKPL